MNRHAILIFALLLCTLTLRAQTERLAYSVQGTVVDADNGKAIESALISIPGTNNATVSNADGYFTIKSAESISRIQVTLLGYKTAVCDITSNAPLKVRLKPESFTLEGATIISGNPLEIVRSAVRKIPSNYSDHPELLECFYRETIRKKTRYTYISEAVARMYKTDYDDGVSRDRTALEKSRVLISQKKSDTLSVKVQGGPAQAAYLDVVKNPDILFGNEAIARYTFSMDAPAFINGRQQFVIRFQPSPGKHDDALYFGTLYIDCEKLLFTRIEMSLDMSDTGKAIRRIVVRKPLTMKLVPKEMSIVVNYSDNGDMARLSYFRSVFRFNCDWKKRLFATSYTAVNELVVTDVRPEAIPIARSDMFRTSDILCDKASEFTDPDFWKDYNIIEPTESLEHAVDRLRKSK
ncbi:MAG: carboxypeptidase-like regulatory domain-containing protein [Bacteroidales bacterium]|nr:carboxypeptidase-like regulatory domain-containing protein [Bacteroidales bacterium]